MVIVTWPQCEATGHGGDWGRWEREALPITGSPSKLQPMVATRSDAIGAPNFFF